MCKLFLSCFIALVWCDIPNRILQTGPNVPMSEFEGLPEQLQVKNPDFEYQFFDDEAALEFMQEHYPDTGLLEVYSDPRLKMVMRADLFRLAAIAVLGGFYFDMDVVAYRNLEPLLSETAVFPREWRRNDAEYKERHGHLPDDEEDHWQMGNYAFGAEPGHPLVQDALKEAFQRSKALLAKQGNENLSDFDVLRTTGPYMLSDIYHNGRKQGKYSDVLFLEGGHEIPLHPKSRGGPTWHKFGKYGEHAIKHTWVRRRLATETELAEILWQANTDKKKDMSWARGIIQELKHRFGELTIANSDSQYSDNKKQEEKKIVTLKRLKEDKRINEIENKKKEDKPEKQDENKENRDKARAERREDKAKAAENAGTKPSRDAQMEKQLAEAHELAKAEGFEVKSHISHSDLEWAAGVLKTHYVRDSGDGFEIAVGTEVYGGVSSRLETGYCVDDSGGEQGRGANQSGMKEIDCFQQCTDNTKLVACAHKASSDICITYDGAVTRGSGDSGYKCFFPDRHHGHELATAEEKEQRRRKRKKKALEEEAKKEEGKQQDQNKQPPDKKKVKPADGENGVAGAGDTSAAAKDSSHVTVGTRVFIFGGILVSVSVLAYVWNSKPAVTDEQRSLLGDYPEEDNF